MMKMAYAFISKRTRRDDVDFYVSRPYSKTDFKGYAKRVRQRARLNGVEILEYTVYEDDREIWRGLF